MTRRHAIVLAAGESRRMGRPKALLSIDGVALVQHHAARFAEAGCDVILVATRPELAEAVRHVLHDVPRATTLVARTTSQSDTLRLAAAHLALDDEDVVFVTPVDVLPPSVDVLARLAGAIDEGAHAATPRFQGRGGHPVALRAATLLGFVAAPLATLRDGLEGLADLRVRIDVDDPRITGDLDEPRDMRGATASLERG